MKFCEHFKLVVLIVALAYASAADKGDGDLLKVLAKERKEISDVFKKENAELRRDDQKLRERDEKLHDRIDKMAEQMGKQNEQISKLHWDNNKLQVQNRKLKHEMTKLRLIRQSDSKVSHLQQGVKHDRQKDQQNQTSEFDQRIKQSIRQKDVNSELKKVIKAEIKDFLISERICVSGTVSGKDGSHYNPTTQHHVDFGYSFPRKPTVSVAISYYEDFYSDFLWKKVYATVSEVTKSSAKISVTKKDVHWSVSWIACL